MELGEGAPKSSLFLCLAGPEEPRSVERQAVVRSSSDPGLPWPLNRPLFPHIVVSPPAYWEEVTGSSHFLVPGHHTNKLITTTQACSGFLRGNVGHESVSMTFKDC